MIILGIPVLNKQELTLQVIESLVETVSDPANFHLVIVDNKSDTPYNLQDYVKLLKKNPFKMSLITEKENVGYYYPLKQMTEQYVTNEQTDLVGLVHNDVIFYEKGWDKRMQESFDQNNSVGLIGLCGSYEVDSNGGRGGGTMCFFNGTKGHPQSAGERIYELRPGVILDSLFMMFRATVVPHLGIDEEITMCHFYDRIWSLKTIAKGWAVGVLGVEIDHMGGITSVGEPRYREDGIEWCKKHNVPLIDGQSDLTIYKLGEQRMFDEFRDGEPKLIPMQVSKNWQYQVI